LQPRVAEAFGGFERFARHRLDAGAEGLDVGRAGVEREADRRPGEVRHDRHRDAVAGGDLQVRAEREIEEIKLHQRRRIAEELYVALRDQAQHAQPRALDPRADHADDDAGDEAHRHQADRGEEAVEEARTVERVVEDGELEAAVLVKNPDPVPEGLEIHLSCHPGRPAGPIRDPCIPALRSQASVMWRDGSRLSLRSAGMTMCAPTTPSSWKTPRASSSGMPRPGYSISSRARSACRCGASLRAAAP